MLCHRVLGLGIALCLTMWAGPALCGPAAECPASTPEGQQVFVASDSSCAEFYLCSNGVPVLLTCPGDLYFNPQTSQCDYRSNVDCDVGASTAAPPAPVSAASSGGVLARRTGSSADPVCPEPAGPFPVLLPNPANCSTYYMCSGGAAVLMPCPPGLLFNNDTWTCDFPKNVVCSTLHKAPSGRPLSARPVRGTTPAPSDQCPRVDGKYPVLLPDPDDCGSFYMCSNGVAIPQKCPTGLLFNNDTWNCDYPENVDCDQSARLPPVRPISAEARRPVSLKLTFDNGCPAVDGKYPTFLPNTDDCSTFYMCSHGVPYLHHCPDGLHFNTHTNTCDYPWRAQCTELEGHEEHLKAAAPAGKCPAVDGRYPTFLPNTDDCSSYYMCSNGVPHLFYCPAGLHFNNRTNTCDYPWRARCTKQKGPEESLKAATPAGSCPAVDGKYPVFLPNTDDCSTYYMCSHGVPHLKTCPDGLYFNNSTWTCDFPQNVPCGSL